MDQNNSTIQFLKSKRQRLFIALTGIFITNVIVAEIIGVKIFSLEQFLGVNPAQIHLWGDFTLDFNLTAGVIIWPVVFVTTDIINEYFGKAGVRRISFTTVILTAYVFLVLWFATGLPPAQFWLDLYKTDSAGNLLNINEAYSKIFLQGAGIIVASLIAFVIGQFTDVWVFQALRKFTGSKMIWLRATGSTLVSQLIDSFVVLFVAFYLLGPWSFEQVIAVGIINYIYKFIVAVILTPLLYMAHYIIDTYLGKELAEEMTESAAQSELF